MLVKFLDKFLHVGPSFNSGDVNRSPSLLVEPSKQVLSRISLLCFWFLCSKSSGSAHDSLFRCFYSFPQILTATPFWGDGVHISIIVLFFLGVVGWLALFWLEPALLSLAAGLWFLRKFWWFMPAFCGLWKLEGSSKFFKMLRYIEIFWWMAPS